MDFCTFHFVILSSFFCHLFPLRSFHLLISPSNLHLDFPSLTPLSPLILSSLLVSAHLHLTDRTALVGSQELVKTPIRNSKKQRLGLPTTVSHDGGDPPLHLSSFYVLPLLTAAFQRCIFAHPLDVPRGWTSKTQERGSNTTLVVWEPARRSEELGLSR